MDIQVIIDNLPLYFQGLWITIILVVISLILGLCLAIPIALLATSKSRWIAMLPKAYIYLPMGFALLVEMLQMRYDYNKKKL